MSAQDVVEALKRDYCTPPFLGPGARPQAPSPEGLARLQEAARRLFEADAPCRSLRCTCDPNSLWRCEYCRGVL